MSYVYPFFLFMLPHQGTRAQPHTKITSKNKQIGLTIVSKKKIHCRPQTVYHIQNETPQTKRHHKQ